MSENECPFKDRHDFKNECFYYFLPLFNYVKKNSIGEKINKFQGSISFSLKEDIYILVENVSDIYSKDFQNEILSSGYLSLYLEKEYKIIECSNKEIKNPPKYNCLLLDDFWNIIKQFDIEEENFNYLCKHGLKNNVNKESLLAVCLVNSCFKEVQYHDFPLIKENKWKVGAKTQYDIPQYIEGIPDGFAIICTTWEAGKVRYYQHIKNQENKNKNDLKNETTNDIDDETKSNIENNKELNFNHKVLNITDPKLLQEPLPRSEHKYCHLCKVKFEDYLEHIKSLTHADNLHKNPFIFERIQKTFIRINSFWDNKNGIRKNRNKININNINNINEQNTNEKTSKEEEISTKEGSAQENTNNNANNINNNINTNSNNINNNNSIILSNNQVEVSIKISNPYVDIKDINQIKKKFTTNTSSQLSTAQSYPIAPIKKRKKADYEKSHELHYVKEIKIRQNETNLGYFISLNAQNPKKLVNNKIIFFK